MSSSTISDAMFAFVFFFNDTATTEIYTLSLHDALPIWSYSYLLDRPFSIESVPLTFANFSILKPQGGIGVINSIITITQFFTPRGIKLGPNCTNLKGSMLV